MRLIEYYKTVYIYIYIRQKQCVVWFGVLGSGPRENGMDNERAAEMRMSQDECVCVCVQE